MRIGILCHSSAGGSGVLATELALGLSQKGHDVHIVGDRVPFRLGEGARGGDELEPIYRDLGDTPPSQSFWGQVVRLVRRSFARRVPSHPATDKIGSVHFHELLAFDYPLFEASSLPTLRAANTLAGLIERLAIEVVNAHYTIPHATSALLARDSGLPVKVVTTLHGTDVTSVGLDPAFYYTTKHALGASDSVTAVCKYLANEARKNFGLQREIEVIPNWVDSLRFVPNINPKERAKVAQPDEMLCIHISNFRSVKRSQDVIRIFARILEKQAARLILLGEGPDKKSCIDLAVELGVSGRMLSVPSMPAVEQYLGICDVLFLPSEMEALPLVILEAMACGAIPITSNVGGIPELIAQEETGYICKVGDVESMAEYAILVFRNKVLANRLRQNARRCVQEQFAPEQMIQRYAESYAEILRGKTNAS